MEPEPSFRPGGAPSRSMQSFARSYALVSLNWHWQACRSRKLSRSSTKKSVSSTNLTASFGILHRQLFGSLPTRRPPESGRRGPPCDGGDTGAGGGGGRRCPIGAPEEP